MTYLKSPHSPRLASRAISTLLAGLVAALCAYFGGIKSAHAVPSFARKYKTSCVTCHTVYPKLNPFGEAFRRDGYRFPSKDGSLDSDNVQAEMLPLGQDEYKKLFPDSVWPDSITQAVPLSMFVNAEAAVNMPNTSAKEDAGNTFGWNDFVGEAAIFAAGSFNDKLTYFVELSAEDGEISPEHAYLIWSDIVGPAHLVNFQIGRFGPTLSSWGMHSTYLADMMFPAESPGMLSNMAYPEDSALAMALGHPDGVEVNGIVAHNVDYSLGWVASGASENLAAPDSQDAYAHIGFKLGGMSLDGEGGCGAQVANPKKPWADTALTIDVFGYHGATNVDTQTSVDPEDPIGQKDQVNAFGGIARLDVQSLSLISGAILEHHSQPFAGTPADLVAGTPGTPNTNSTTALLQFNELSYVVFPWLVPAIRTEYTRIGTALGGHAALLRIMPGVAALIRPNIKVGVKVDIEHSVKGAPPTTGSWEPAGGAIEGSGENKTEAEQIIGNLAWAF